jgi:GNAT superfamily N-acetyltransferase
VIITPTLSLPHQGGGDRGEANAKNDRQEINLGYSFYGQDMIRTCDPGEFEGIYEIINDAAQAYRGVIPADRWKDPYLPREELRHEIYEGVVFWGYEEEGRLLGIMGLQQVQDVTLIRHSYVWTARRNQGIGGKLLSHLKAQTDRPLLVGTWAAIVWAIRFYEKHGFHLVSPGEKNRLLKKYWSIPDRQVETSVVLADPKWFEKSKQNGAGMGR